MPKKELFNGIMKNIVGKKTVWIGNDHGGYALKCKIKEYLTENGYPVVDVGSDCETIVRYPYYATKVAQAVSETSENVGVLICSTGIGMSIIANKFPGVRAALCTSTYMGRMTREHNNSNVLCLGGKITGEFEALDIVKTWLSTDFIGGRHNISLDLIHKVEEQLYQQTTNVNLPDEDSLTAFD